MDRLAGLIGPRHIGRFGALDTAASFIERELSESVARIVGSVNRRVYLFPFSLHGQVVGVLYAEPGDTPVNVSGLELLAALAETTIEPRDAAQPRPEGFIRITGVPEAGPPAAGAPAWSALPPEQQESHARAERFARTAVARIMLYKMDQVRSGRSSGDLYAALKDDIEAGRDAYRTQFLSAGQAVPDYLHAELVRTLAKGAPALLGPSYPGPLE